MKRGILIASLVVVIIGFISISLMFGFLGLTGEVVGEIADCNVADLNGDGYVNLADYTDLENNYGRNDCCLGNVCCGRADINADGEINLEDYIILEDNYGAITGDCDFLDLNCSVCKSGEIVDVNNTGELLALSGSLEEKGFWQSIKDFFYNLFWR